MSLFSPDLCQEELAERFGHKYEIVDYLDEGGQAEVWLVRDDEQDLALKIYPLRDSIELRVDREINAFERVNCDSIVSLKDYGRVEIRGEECTFYCTKYIEGQSLANRLSKDDQLNAEEAKQLIRDIGQAISSLWNERIVHRDIKPSNILLNNGEFILIDLGIAKHLDEKTATEYGKTLGTLGYMSPEQMKGRKNITLKSDYFSLGIVVYESVTGLHPFSSRQDLIPKIDPTPVQGNIDISNELAKCVHTLLRKRKIERPKNYNELVTLLD